MKNTEKKTKTTPIQNKNPSKLHDILVIIVLLIIIIVSITFTYFELKSNNIFWKIQGYRSLIVMPFFIIGCCIFIWISIINLRK
jgi:uncharacterized integral membrane protein